MESQPAFERNLAQLRARHPRVAQACAQAEPGASALVRGPRGSLSVSCDGVLLASAYDPEGEGARLAEEMAREPADVLVAIGFGLGHHLEAYRARHACPLLIFEPSPAALRAALAARPGLTLLGLPDVHLCVDAQEIGMLLARVYTPGLRLRVFPHPAALRLAPEAVREAVRRVARAKDALDVVAQTRVSMTERWARITVENAPALLRTPSFERLRGAFPGLPAVVAAAGPSLDRQLELLRRERSRVLVIAIGQTLRALRAAGIEPDLVHVLESQDVRHQITQAGDSSALTLVVPPSVHPGLFELPVRARFVAYPIANLVGCWIARTLGDRRFALGGATVAQSAVQLAAALGASPILLIGQDLAFTGGRAYASGSAYDGVGFRATAGGGYVLENTRVKAQLFGTDDRGRPDDPEREIVWVEGWDGERVPTSVSYASFIEHYRGIAEFLRAGGIRLLNCTEGGARLPGVEHARFADALAAAPARPLDPAPLLRRIHDEATPATPERFEEALARVRRGLTGVESAARAALKECERVARGLRGAHSPQRKIDLLRRIARGDRSVRRGLAEVPWLEAVVQPELHRVLAVSRSAEAAAPSAEQALGESQLLFEATLAGVDRARALLEHFEARLAAAAEPGEGAERACAAEPPEHAAPGATT